MNASEQTEMKKVLEAPHKNHSKTSVSLQKTALTYLNNFPCSRNWINSLKSNLTKQRYAKNLYRFCCGVKLHPNELLKLKIDQTDILLMTEQERQELRKNFDKKLAEHTLENYVWFSLDYFSFQYSSNPKTYHEWKRHTNTNHDLTVWKVDTPYTVECKFTSKPIFASWYKYGWNRETDIFLTNNKDHIPTEIQNHLALYDKRLMDMTDFLNFMLDEQLTENEQLIINEGNKTCVLKCCLLVDCWGYGSFNVPSDSKLIQSTVKLKQTG